MRRRDLIVLLGSAAIVPMSAHAEQASAATTIAARLVGAWQFMSSVSVRVFQQPAAFSNFVR